MNLSCRMAAVALVLCAAPAGAQADLSTAKLVTLRNGLRVLLAPDTTATSVGVSLWCDAGTRTEPAGRSGITQLVERLRMHRPEPLRLQRDLERHGGTVASFTTPDVSDLALTVPADRLRDALALQAAWMAALQPTPAAIAEELRAQREEAPRRPEASPHGHATRRLFELLDPGTPYGPPVAGRDEDLARIAPREVLDYDRARFGTVGALLTIVGRFDPGEALAFCASSVERLPRHGTNAPSRPRAAAAGASGRASEATDFRLPVLFAGWRAPAASSADAAALDLLGRVLTGGASSRLTHALVSPEAGGVLVVGGYDGRRDGGMLYAAVTAAPDADRAKLEQALTAEVERLATEPVSEEELQRVRRQMENSMLTGWQSTWERGQALGNAQMLAGDWRLAWGHLALVRALTPADVLRAAASVLRPDRRAVVWLTPKDAPAEGGAR